MNVLRAYRSRSSNLIVDGAGLIAVISLALFVRLHAITVPAVWYDEAFSLLIAKETPWQIWSITARDVYPPLYYVLLHYWMQLFGDGVLSARSLSVLADVGTLLLSIKLMSLVSTRRATWIAALLLALLPISVRYSQEVRMYTMVGFWLMGATVALVCWVNAPERKRFPIMYVLLMTAAFYTHYFAALCVLVHWLYWLAQRGGAQDSILSTRAWTVANIAIIVLYLPWMPNFIHQLLQRDGLGWIPPLTWQTVLNIVWQFSVMTTSMAASSWWHVVPTVLILVCAASMLSNDRIERGNRVLLVGYFFVPVLTAFLLCLFVPIFNARYLAFAAVGLPLLVAVALDAWGTDRRVLTFATFAFFLGGETQGLSAIYQQTDGLNGTAVRQMARLDILAAGIGREARSDDEIVVDGLFSYLPFMYYNTTDIQPRIYVFRSSTGEAWDPVDFGGWVLVPRRADGMTFNDFSVMKPKARRVWWVTGKYSSEHSRLFPKNWIQVLTLRGGESESRLFVLDGAPTPHEIAIQPLFTQQLPH